MRRALLAFLAALLVAGCSWPQFRGDAAHTGFQPFESKIDASNVSLLSEAWTAQLGPTTSSPVVAGGRLYVGEGGFPRAEVRYSVFDAAGQASCSGAPKVCRPLWQVALIGGNSPATPAVANGFLYVNFDVGVLQAFDVAACEAGPQCAPVWGADAAGTPVVSGGVVYASRFDSVGISAYDAAGTTNCAVRPGGTRFCEPLWTTSTDSPVGTVAVAGGVAYVSSRDGTLYAYDAAGQRSCAGTPRVCAPLWIALTGGGSTPVVSEGRVYTMDDSSRLLRAFDAAGVADCNPGTQTHCLPLWTATVPLSAGDSPFHAPAVANGRVYVGNAVYDASGATNCSGTPRVCDPLWRVAGDGPFPVVANGVEFTGGATPPVGDPLRLHAFDATGTSQCTGRTPIVCAPLWTVDPGGAISGSPAIVNGVLYLATLGDPAESFAGSTLHAYVEP